MYAHFELTETMENIVCFHDKKKESQRLCFQLLSNTSEAETNLKNFKLRGPNEAFIRTPPDVNLPNIQPNALDLSHRHTLTQNHARMCDKF